MARRSKKIGDLREGYSRTFINIYKDGKSMSIGIPKPSNPNRSVYIKNGGYSGYISPDAGRQLIGQTFSRVTGYSSRALPSGSSYGYCSNCGKRLRGNIYKSYCTECWRNGYR